MDLWSGIVVCSMYFPHANWKKSLQGSIDSSIELIRLAASFTQPLVKQTLASGLGLGGKLFENQGGCWIPGCCTRKVSAGVKTENVKWKQSNQNQKMPKTPDDEAKGKRRFGRSSKIQVVAILLTQV